ncbi:MerR family transcriptional regulator [Paenibacillus sp. GCM10023248]|uniref:MerR family transcriptional regulator n=1 Tax=Bacillales TaxID=1385 RepID=UPI002378FA77|nr:MULTISPECIES: MerR family transcriptional regulator [Bacillales]MDD9269609.1 MerR family transcriptional regulator [Paenibacillus sp. MAHUQ-63]MDR6880757.1 DNA-binding transcriptional MerR regulator [Bacillus sp. 3255]
MEYTFSIAEISQKTNLSYDTIRYYGKLGLLPPTKLNEHGRREYGSVHLERLLFITHLKRTGMPLKEIEKYMTLATTKQYVNCYRILCAHKLDIELQLKEIQESLSVVNYKIEHFNELMKQLKLGGE